MPDDLTDDLTDDMRALLRAAWNAAPDGEPFILEKLHLPKLSKRARMDCVYTLSHEPRRYVDTVTADALRERGIDRVEGLNYLALSKRGRPVGKQLATNRIKARWQKVNAIVTWIALALLTGALGLMWNHLDRKIQQREIIQPAPATAPR